MSSMSERARRLVSAMALMFASATVRTTEARAADAAASASTWALARHKRRAGIATRITVTSSDCPLPGCRSCRIEVPAWMSAPTATPDYSRHLWPAARTTSQVICWLRERYADAWYFADTETLADTADRLLMVRGKAALRELQP